MEITGKEFVNGIISILRKKNKTFVSFDPKSYDENLTKDELPWCCAFDQMVDTISAPGLLDEKTLARAYDPEDLVKMAGKGFPGCLCISVCTEGGVIFHDFFDGSEDEDWEHLFIDVYDELRSSDDGEGDFWIEALIRHQRTDKAIEKAKELLTDYGIEMLKETPGKKEIHPTKAIRVDKFNSDFDEYLPVWVKPKRIYLENGELFIDYQYEDEERTMDDRSQVRQMSLSDIQSVVYSIEDTIIDLLNL